MALTLIYGNPGSGKSTYVYEKVLRMAAADSRRRFYVIVPEQFTMQTQRELVRRSAGGVIMNVDVVSFERLAYRIFDELGICNTIMEETGKSLVLRRIAEKKSDELTVLKGNIRRMGYIGEIKSMISELMQYDISVEELEAFMEDMPSSSTLYYKLSDIAVMYRAFDAYLSDRYVTAEQVLEVLLEAAEDSRLLRGAMLVFDGFTGFTPIQMKLLQTLMHIVGDMDVTITMDVRESPCAGRGIWELFYMSERMTLSLLEAAKREHFLVKEPVFLNRQREVPPVLAALEQNLFRSRVGVCREECGDALQIYAAQTPKAELEFAAAKIGTMMREGAFHYSDFAIVSSDVETYANYASEVFETYGLPFFVDQKNTVLAHPMIELIRAALEMVDRDFSYESVLRYLRTGLTGFTDAEVDALETYVIARGIRGASKWSRRFIRPMRGSGRIKKSEETLQRELMEAEGLRARFWEQVEELYRAFKEKNVTVSEQTMALYRFLSRLSLETQLLEKQMGFEAVGDQRLASEYRQIYKLVMDLLDKLNDLLGDQILSVGEYADVLEAGFAEARIGSIPAGSDCVILGDIERTRLDGVKVLFFLGVNDGKVPASGGGAGILSQYDRELLEKQELKLAPTEREQAFLQRFYLYLCMTKPTQALILTYAGMNPDGKSIRPSYLIGTLKQIFPGLTVRDAGAFRLPVTPKSSMNAYLDGLMRAGSGEVGEEWKALHHWLLRREAFAPAVVQLFDAAFGSYEREQLSRDAAKRLYGTVLNSSVTRLELLARCAFAHFAEYGLKLSPREEYTFAALDMGSMFHEILQRYCVHLEEDPQYDWFDVTREAQTKLLSEAMEEAVLAMPNESLLETERGAYMLERIRRIMERSVWALTKQIRSGSFRPVGYEVEFFLDAQEQAEAANDAGVDQADADNTDADQTAASDAGADEAAAADDAGADNAGTVERSADEPSAQESRLRLVGRIDRVDTYETEGKLYVKVVDYKSGDTAFQLLNLYYGQQLQLVVYLNAAMEQLKRKNPDREIVPAGIFYYHLDDPMVDEAESEEEILDKILKELKPKGLLSAEPEAYLHMDEGLTGASKVIPLTLNQDGSVRQSASVVTGERFHSLSRFVSRTILRQEERIRSGEIAPEPYRLDDATGCDYCAYRSVCGFDPKLPGYHYEKKESLKPEEIWERIGKEAEENETLQSE